MAKKGKNYNTIYNTLVPNKNDIIGHIAYSIYKFEKREYIKEYCKEHKVQPSKEDLDKFVNSCKLKPRLESYRNNAESLLQKITEAVISRKVDDIEKDLQEKHEAKCNSCIRRIEKALNTTLKDSDAVKKCLSHIEKKPTYKRIFWTNVSSSLVASFIWAVLIALLTIIIFVSNKEILNALKEILRIN